MMGKPNVPKMANFMEVDIFVLVACPENSLIDSQVSVLSSVNVLKIFSYVRLNLQPYDN